MIPERPDGSPDGRAGRSLRGARVFVTGGTGFIGRRLLRELLTCGPAEIRVLIRRNSRAGELPDSPSIRPVEGDIRDPDAFSGALGGLDYVFHLAGLTRARDEAAFMAVNAEATGVLAARVERASPGLRRFLLVSSLAAVGPVVVGDRVTEGTPAAPVSAYGRSKLAGEKQLIQRSGSLPWTIVRPPAVYGPGERDLFTLFRMARRGFAPLVGIRAKHLSFVYSEDLCEAMIAAATAPASRGRAYFVAHPEVRTDRELVQNIYAAFGRVGFSPRLPATLLWAAGAVGSLISPFLSRPPLLTLDRMHEISPTRWVCDGSALERDSGHRCLTNLAAGIPQTADWYVEQGWLPPPSTRSRR